MRYFLILCLCCGTINIFCLNINVNAGAYLPTRFEVKTDHNIPNSTLPTKHTEGVSPGLLVNTSVTEHWGKNGQIGIGLAYLSGLFSEEKMEFRGFSYTAFYGIICV